MSPKLSPQPELVALLSAASVADGGNIGALQDIAGSSLIGWQISTLQKSGVATFLVEVDSVPGGLLNLADSLRNTGVRVEFVRSAKDLQSFLKPAAKLVVLAEAHYFSAPMLAELLQSNSRFIATIDGRDENEPFERMDLNTRWAGFAQLDAATAQSLMELPEGWSITSSLLRHAIQCGTRFSPVAQAKVQSGDIARISDRAGADKLIESMLRERIQEATGVIERHIFGPIAKRIAPYSWASRTGAGVVQISALVGAIVSFGFGVMGWNIAGSATALLALFLRIFSGVIGAIGEARQHRLQSLLFFGLLGAAAFVAALASADHGPDAAAFMAISIGLMAASNKILLPRWASSVLQSPATLAAAMLIAASMSVFALGTKIFAMAVLCLLIAGLYLPAPKGKNNGHA